MQAGSCPSALLRAHKSQLAANFVWVLKSIIPKGQANTHSVQPVHFSESSATPPPLKLNARVGHVIAHGAGSHCRQVSGTANRFATRMTLIKLSPSFSRWQATSHPLQFIQRSKSA